MAGSVNKVILIGNLGSDPELRSTAGGTAVANLSIATNERYQDKEGNWQDRTEWHRVVVFGRQAELVKQYLSKGRKVYIEGRLQTRSWDDAQSGQKRYSTEIVAGPRGVTFLDSAGQGGGGGGYSGGGGGGGGGGYSGGGGGGYSGGGQQQPRGGGGGGYGGQQQQGGYGGQQQGGGGYGGGGQQQQGGQQQGGQQQGGGRPQQQQAPAPAQPAAPAASGGGKDPGYFDDDDIPF